jgi:hypothetical protein
MEGGEEKRRRRGGGGGWKGKVEFLENARDKKVLYCFLYTFLFYHLFLF